MPAYQKEPYEAGWKRACVIHALKAARFFFSFSWIDQYLKRFEVNENIADAIVNEALREISRGEWPL